MRSGVQHGRRTRSAPSPAFRARRRLWPTLTFVFLCIVSIAMAAPFLWMITTALKAPHEVLLAPPQWIPSALRWDNFVTAWNMAPFDRFYFNSVIVAVTATFLELVVGILSAYAFARLRFPGRDLVFLAVLATLMIPVDITILPNYITLSRLGWIDTYWALIIPPASNAFGTFLLRQHILGIPKAMFDAARLDGASHLQLLRHVVVPMSWPVISALALIGFIDKWNSYLWPLIVTNSTAMRTLPVGLVFLRPQDGGTPYHLLMAATTFVVAPIVILFLFTQRQFIEGIARGAVKGGG